MRTRIRRRRTGPRERASGRACAGKCEVRRMRACVNLLRISCLWQMHPRRLPDNRGKPCKSVARRGLQELRIENQLQLPRLVLVGLGAHWRCAWMRLSAETRESTPRETAWPRLRSVPRAWGPLRSESRNPGATPHAMSRKNAGSIAEKGAVPRGHRRSR